MKLRLLSTSVALPIVIAATFLGGIWFTALIAFGAIVAGYEMAHMLRLRHISARPRVSALISGTLVIGSFILILLDKFLLFFSIICIPTTILSVIWIALARSPGKYGNLSIIGTLASGLYIGGFLSHAPLMRESEKGLEWVLFLLLVTILTDTGAYAIGKSFGKHALYPKISPSKTVEGAVAGVICAAIGSLAAGIVIKELDLSISLSVCLGLMLSVGAQGGDLYESALKRLSNLKDSGNLIPGHGGALDRLDSIVFNLGLLYYFVQWTGT